MKLLNLNDCGIKSKTLLRSSPVECSFRIPLGKYFTGQVHEIAPIAIGAKFNVYGLIMANFIILCFFTDCRLIIYETMFFI